ncbi:hypothetical protein Trydic_g400 [Trypoxylus dichotomus]
MYTGDTNFVNPSPGDLLQQSSSFFSPRLNSNNYAKAFKAGEGLAQRRPPSRRLTGGAKRNPPNNFAIFARKAFPSHIRGYAVTYRTSTAPPPPKTLIFQVVGAESDFT